MVFRKVVGNCVNSKKWLAHLEEEKEIPIDEEKKKGKTKVAMLF